MYDYKIVIDELVGKHGIDREALMPILQGIVRKHRYLSEDAMAYTAKKLDISTAQVYGTATFYSFLDTEERGENVIRVCKSISCDMKDKKAIVKAIEEKLKIKVGETTHDKKFSLLEANCLGWCHKAPAILINETPYTELTPDKVLDLISEYKKK